jgi:hypothetical protein
MVVLLLSVLSLIYTLYPCMQSPLSYPLVSSSLSMIPSRTSSSLKGDTSSSRSRSSIEQGPKTKGRFICLPRASWNSLGRNKSNCLRSSPGYALKSSYLASGSASAAGACFLSSFSPFFGFLTAFLEAATLAASFFSSSIEMSLALASAKVFVYSASSEILLPYTWARVVAKSGYLSEVKQLLKLSYTHLSF